MHKKLMLACMAIAAFAAFVIAPSAQASPVLTSEGKTVPVGTSITAKNTGETLFTGIFNVKCTVAHMTGVTTVDTGTVIAGTIPKGNANFNGTGAGGDCTSALGDVRVEVESELCIETIAKTDEVTIDGCLIETSPGVKTTEPIAFILELTGSGPCTYKVNTIKGTYVTGPATVNISEQEAKLSEGNFFCPTSGKLDMDFDLYTTGPTPGGPPGSQLTVS